MSLSISPEAVDPELAATRQDLADARKLLAEWRDAFALEQEPNPTAIARVQRTLMAQHDARRAVEQLRSAQEGERMALDQARIAKGRAADLQATIEAMRTHVRERDFILLDVNRELEGVVPIDPTVALATRVAWLVREVKRLRRADEMLQQVNAWRYVPAMPGAGMPATTKPKARRKAAKRRRGAR